MFEFCRTCGTLLPGIVAAMTEERPPESARAPACRWRTSAETLDLIEALERMESLLVRLDQRLSRLQGAETSQDESPPARRRV